MPHDNRTVSNSSAIAPSTLGSGGFTDTVVRLSSRGGGRVVGIALMLLGMLQYRSERATVLGRWSTPLLSIALGLFLLWVILLVRAARGRAVAPVSRAARVRVVTADTAVLVWGLGYFLAALDSPLAGASLISGNLLGSSVPVSIILYWLALALLTAAAATAVARFSGTRANVATLVAATVVAFVLCEGWQRFRALATPETQGFPTYRAELWDRRHVALNRLGFRDGERNLVAQPGGRRVLLVGDSYTFGTGINRTQDRFGERLQRHLESLTGTPWEVINAGQPDRHTLEETQTLLCMLPFRPDVVVLVYVFNDIDYLRAVIPRPGVSEAPRGILQRLHPVRLLYINSFLFQQVYVRLRALASHRGTAKLRLDDPYLDRSLLSRHMQDLARFIEIARASGAAALIVPFDIGVTADAGLRRRYQTFIAAARAMEIPVIELDAAFAGEEFARLSINVLDRHPNELANRIAADAVAPTIASLASPPGSRASEPERGAAAPPASCLSRGKS